MGFIVGVLVCNMKLSREFIAYKHHENSSYPVIATANNSAAFDKLITAPSTKTVRKSPRSLLVAVEGRASRACVRVLIERFYTKVHKYKLCRLTH